MKLMQHMAINDKPKDIDVELLAEEIAIKLHLVADGDQEAIEKVIRSHIPTQPPIPKRKCLACKGSGFIHSIGWNDGMTGTEQHAHHCGECGGTGYER